MATISALGIGSGLDLNGLLDQLQAAEQEKLVPIINNKRSFESKISAYGQLTSSLSSLQSSVTKLSSGTLFDAVKSTVSGTALTAAASAGTPLGNYEVNVTQLARAYSVATTGIADKGTNLGAGTVTIGLANGDSFTVTVGSEDSSLEAIRDGINAQNAGVSASIVNDGSGTPYRLSLVSRETGAEAAISSVDFGDLSASLALDATTEVSALNATATINGIDIVSQSNQLNDVIEGMTLILAEEGSASVAVTSNTETITNAVGDFVSAYNKLQEKIANLTSYDAETGVAGELLGDNTMRTVELRLRNVLAEGMPGGELSMLSDLGISLQLDGSLAIDDEALSELTSSNLSGLANFFAGVDGEKGLADKLGNSLEQMLKDNGLLDISTDGLENRIERLDDRYDRVQKSISATIARYQAQFSQLDSTIGRMNSTSAYIAQQFDILNAQLNQ
ncbi:MAG: flagellar hook protein [Gammaproteobacteria bacterium]|nr:MAG: flagellar hook protein [Gammaproteobacteria bacterium]